MNQTQAERVPAETVSTARLRWQCRRGMLELDLLLNAFLDNSYAKLSIGEQQVFQTLLEYPDQTLYDLLMRSMISSDREIADMVVLIQENMLRKSA